ncbi:DNA polymerase III subunit epsilon [Aestuariivirga litoralis]|uniref:DNA polymerase III subunit epsilon n=1 Tax=Aestuariivirga litoralis TaxID=2650924 RepID=A0A2W2AUN2_9HYPH|nr:DNA polymerase III subunit epsilon [Aestuariivirga litoralis]PZF77432.1 DNA polymerase III subunit epsilon [Aestuariivirga litoralis]
MREIILDTETTGLDPATGDRIVEIGAVELLNHLPTGRTFHVYINPERDMPKEAEAVHGLSSAFLKDKPVFGAIAQDFLQFIGEDVLIIHNASFDMAFINAELGFLRMPAIPPERVIDTLHIARQKHPGAGNSLDALCRRYGIDNSKRSKHGALLDSELLAEVYLELIGGRQTALVLEAAVTRKAAAVVATQLAQQRSVPLPSRLTESERIAHAAFVAELGDQALWKQGLN